MSCSHQNFKVSADINRITQKEGDLDPSAFMADIRLECVDCGTPFEWIGVPMGLSFVRPNVSVDCLELRAPVKPKGEPMPLAATLPGFGVKRTV